MSKKKKKNLIPFNERSESEVKEIAKRGGIKSGQARRELKAQKERLRLLLSMTNKETGNMYADDIDAAAVKKAISGDIKACEFIRDTIGEKPPEKVEATNANVSVTDPDVIKKVIEKIKEL